MARERRQLIKNPKYQGKYVAFSASGKKVIASGSNPGTVVEKARKQGVKVPAIVFVPRKDIAYIY